MHRNHIDVYLETLAREGGSDLHLAPGLAPRIRIDGTLQAMQTDPLTDAQIRQILDQIMEPDARSAWQSHMNADFAYDGRELGRFRVNTLVQRYGAAAVFRIIPARVPTCDELNLPRAVREIADLGSGLVLVTGPTGSGKSTTLAALVDSINHRRGGHIVTIEDPIEFAHESRSCIVTQRELGSHVNSFPDALRAALREDPDVIVVGEMRDPVTIELALTAAETGHLVLGTLHTYSAMKAVDRIVDAMATDRQQQIRTQLSEVLKVVVAQRLLPSATGRGRVAAFEVMINNTAITNMLRKGNTAQIQSAMNDAGSGMQTMEQALAQLVTAGWLHAAVGRSQANDNDQFDQALRTLQRTEY